MTEQPAGRVTVVALACAALLAGLVVEVPRRVFRQMAPSPRSIVVLDEPIVATPAAPEPPPIRVETIALERGDTLVQALVRGGLDAATANEMARRFKKHGAYLRRLRPGDMLTITRSRRDGRILWPHRRRAAIRGEEG